MAESHTTHGAKRSLTAYQRMLAAGLGEAWDAAHAQVTVEDELRWARAKFAKLAASGRPEDEPGQMYLLDRIRQLAQAQKELVPGGDVAGELTLKIEVKDG